jgi:XTP/dITP diphosphohydrolase
LLNGNIIHEPRGDNGFGYDPIFEVNGKTLAEMTLGEKSNISHRKIAAVKLVEKLNEI